MKIGVLSLQGGVAEHLKHIEKTGNEAVEVKKTEHLEGIDGIILPGGESTAMGKILREVNMLEPLRKKIQNGLPAWGTCAGMILLAKEIENDERRHLQVMDIRVKRNAYGSQLDSFNTQRILKDVGTDPIELIFIRAPYISGLLGDDVEVLCDIDGKVVAARQKNMIATSFHPELSGSLKFHEYFIDFCKSFK